MGDRMAGAAGSAVERMSLRARQIGHDLNNCFGIVGGRAELALVQLDRGNVESARKGVQTIVDQMEKINALTEALRRLDEST